MKMRMSKKSYEMGSKFVIFFESFDSDMMTPLDLQQWRHIEENRTPDLTIDPWMYQVLT